MKFSDLALMIMEHESRDLGNGASDSEIKVAECSLGVQIDGGYRLFLKRFGWGGIEHLELYGLGIGVPPHLDLVRITKSERTEMEPKLPRALIPINNDGGGNLFCLDSSVPLEPPVVFWDHTGESDQDASVEAESFVHWLAFELSPPASTLGHVEKLE